MTPEEIEFYENNKCCRTCKWHYRNPYARPFGAHLPPWICGCPGSKQIGKGRVESSGKSCNEYEIRDVDIWRKEQDMCVRRKVNSRGKMEWINLTVYADDIYNFFHSLDKIEEMGVEEKIHATVREFDISAKYVNKALDYKEFMEEHRS